MGSNKPEKRMKKTKKRSKVELVSNGEHGATASECDDVHPTIDKNEENVVELEAATNKSKKARRNKNKGVPSNEHNEEANLGEASEPDSESRLRKRKDKSKIEHRNKSGDIAASNAHNKVVNQGEASEPDSESHSLKRKGKSKKALKKSKNHQSSNAESMPVKEVEEAAPHDVYQISSGEDDCSKGMKKWIKEYYESRPDLKVLQQKIDDFITAHEEQEEQAKREREAKIAEEGWTVVVHRKGGKRTTDPDSGVAVGSVAEAAVRDKLAKKKSKDVGLDFYRFQRKEAKRNEIMQLQSKFEEDKKRIQQIRAARKFRPY